MIRSTLFLARTSLPAVSLLAASLFALAGIFLDDPDSPIADPAGSIPALDPVAKSKHASGVGSAILRAAMFDPGHRSETISGSIDDLRPGGSPQVTAPVTIAGVLMSGGTRKAMLATGGSAPSWSGVGDERGGWRVVAVDSEGALLEHDGRSVRLQVADRYKQRGKPQGDAGAPAAPAIGAAESEPIELPPDP